jgi:phosphatidylserine/phosphatidylglycerophosphate/cardiolipin synthase-like enzyme
MTCKNLSERIRFDLSQSPCCNQATLETGAYQRGKLERFDHAAARAGQPRGLGLPANGFLILLFVLLLSVAPGPAAMAPASQESLDAWRALTSTSAPPPRAYVKGNEVRFYFQVEGSVTAFSANWSRVRVPTPDYKVNSAILRWDRGLTQFPPAGNGWREAAVIAGADWKRMAIHLLSALAPAEPGKAVCYQSFLADRILYRDSQGAVHLAPERDAPEGVVLERRYTAEESLEILAQRAEADLRESHPGETLFLLMAPNASLVTHPLLLDRQHRQCVWLTPAAVRDSTDRRLGPGINPRAISAILPEAHGLALLKNPVSSVARLADLGVASVTKFVRFPLPKPGKAIPPLASGGGMDLTAWESWLDKYTGTRLEEGSLSLQIDGDQFFGRFQEALTRATNSIHLLMYIFDRDDVAVSIADLLRERSAGIDVKVILDRLGSVGGGTVPPGTPLPEDFTPPVSISAYLKRDSRVQVRPYLNPWFSSEHSKVLMVDSAVAWLGGMNLGREYRYEWHDLMVELRGPVVGTLEADFRREWAHCGPWGDLAYTAAVLASARKTNTWSNSEGWVQVRLLPTRTAWKPFSAAVQASFRKARNHIYIENPYLFDKRIILGLVQARKRGVDVRVILPRVNDFKAGGRGNLVIANYLIERGVRVYFYPGMTHVKALLVDGWSCLGSANLNHLSLRVNQEQNVATSDPAFAVQLKRDLFEEDFARSYELKEPVSVGWVDFLADLLLEGL